MDELNGVSLLDYIENHDDCGDMARSLQRYIDGNEDDIKTTIFLFIERYKEEQKELENAGGEK